MKIKRSFFRLERNVKRVRLVLMKVIGQVNKHYSSSENQIPLSKKKNLPNSNNRIPLGSVVVPVSI
jgi:hypothetical protein